MSIIYPHILKSDITGDSTTGPRGEIIPGTVTILSTPCRYRPNTQAKTIITVDGESVAYRGTCYLPKGVLPLTNGDLITVPGFIDEPTKILQIHPATFRTRIIL